MIGTCAFGVSREAMPSPIDRNQPQGDVALLQIGPAKAVEVPIAEFLQGDFSTQCVELGRNHYLTNVAKSVAVLAQSFYP